MTEKTYQTIARYGGILALACVVASGYLVMRHWELYRHLGQAEVQYEGAQRVAMQQQVYQQLLREFAMRMGKDQKIAEILQRNLGAATQPAPAPATTPAPTKEPGANP